jgi:4-carboxymuconolactone decarboxylase
MVAMSRLPYMKRDDLDDAGRAVWDTIESSRGAQVVNDEGGLVGPFNAWVTAPNVGARLLDLGGALRFESSIDRRLLEVAIITTGAHWHAEFEWWAHSRMALDNGVSPAVVDAIQVGAEPRFEHDGERIVHNVARQLATTGRVDEATFEEARILLGDGGLVELVALCGFYALVSYTLNAFDVPLPPGAESAWKD